MMRSLIHTLLEALFPAEFRNDASRRERVAHDAVNFIEVQPELHIQTVFFKAGSCKTDKAVNHMPVRPAVVMLGQIQRHLIMRQRDQRFDVILLHFREQAMVERNSFRIRRFFFACRVQSRPGNGNS